VLVSSFLVFFLKDVLITISASILPAHNTRLTRELLGKANQFNSTAHLGLEVETIGGEYVLYFDLLRAPSGEPY
jgi:hypothetical protein